MIFDLDQHQLDSFERILERNGLPTADIRQVDWFALIGWHDQRATVGVAGMERCGNLLLLRSVAIEQSYRNKGLASALVKMLHQRAQDSGYARSYLLTLDASDYFRKKFDYRAINRTQAPQEVAQSSQFLTICPATAVLMGKSLKNP